MQRRKNDCAPSFNLWTAHRTWFWSLAYPDRQGGAIGAAGSQAEALSEAHAAIERLPQPGDESGLMLAPLDDSAFMRPFQNSNNSHDPIGREIDRLTGDLEGSRMAPKRRTGVRTIADCYNDLWRLSLQHYAARVAAV
jgi:hypothetical protein